MPRHRRRIGYVFQDARLFPHLTVRRNLLYGRWFAGRRRRRGSLDEVVELLGIAPLLERRPGHAVGRRAAAGGDRPGAAGGPRLLLLDEPLASLDQARKAEILPYPRPALPRGRHPDPVRQPRARGGDPPRDHHGAALRRPGRGHGSGGRGDGAPGPGRRRRASGRRRPPACAGGGPARGGWPDRAGASGRRDRAAGAATCRSARPSACGSTRATSCWRWAPCRWPGSASATSCAPPWSRLGAADGGTIEVGLDVAGEALRARITAASADGHAAPARAAGAGAGQERGTRPGCRDARRRGWLERPA